MIHVGAYDSKCAVIFQVRIKELCIYLTENFYFKGEKLNEKYSLGHFQLRFCKLRLDFELEIALGLDLELVFEKGFELSKYWTKSDEKMLHRTF